MSGSEPGLSVETGLSVVLATTSGNGPDRCVQSDLVLWRQETAPEIEMILIKQ